LNARTTYRVEQTIGLREVDDVDPDGLNEIAGVFHPEVEPLQVADAIRIVAHPTVEDSLGLQAHLV